MSSLREDPSVADEAVEVEVVDDEPPAKPKRGNLANIEAHTWKPGQSGNPGGRPKGIARRVREMVGDDPAAIMNVFYDILYDPKARDTDRIAAGREILDRGWGKSPSYQPIENTDPLELSELDKAIRDIADSLVVRRSHPVLDAEVVQQELINGYRPPAGD